MKIVSANTQVMGKWHGNDRSARQSGEKRKQVSKKCKKNMFGFFRFSFNPILLGGGQICPRTFFWKNYSAELYKCYIFWLLEIFSINLDLNNFQKNKTG